MQPYRLSQPAAWSGSVRNLRIARQCSHSSSLNSCAESGRQKRDKVAARLHFQMANQTRAALLRSWLGVRHLSEGGTGLSHRFFSRRMSRALETMLQKQPARPSMPTQPRMHSTTPLTHSTQSSVAFSETMPSAQAAGDAASRR